MRKILLRIILAFLIILCVLLAALYINSQNELHGLNNMLQNDMLSGVKRITITGINLIRSVEENDQESFDALYMDLNQEYGAYMLAWVRVDTDLLDLHIYEPRSKFWGDTVSSVLFHVPVNINDCVDTNEQWVEFKKLIDLFSGYINAVSLEDMLIGIDKDLKTTEY